MKISLANSPKVCYTETAPQLNKRYKYMATTKARCILLSRIFISWKVVAQHIGILSAGVPNVERPYFLPANIKFKGETEVEQDKKKILSDLYAIRATMSLIAENDEKNAEPERQAIQNLKRQQRNAQEEIANSEKKLASVLYERKKKLKEHIEELRKKQEQKTWELRTQRSEKENDYNFRKRLVNRSFASCLWETLWDHSNVEGLLGVILVILIIASIALSFALGNLWIGGGYSIASLGEYWSGVLITATICLAIICAYFFGVCISVTVYDRRCRWLRYVRSKAEFQQADRELNAELQQADPKLKNMTEIYEAYDERVNDVDYSWQIPVYKKVTSPKHHCSEINELIQAHEKEVAALEKKKENLEQQKNPHCELLKANGEEVSAIVESATKAYFLIDFRDWENVDLLIYYFETGRADDMKEALQLVDRQRQTEMLAKAIAMASAEICKTIHHSMNQLGNALAQSFSLLSSQMARQHNELLREMEEQAAAQKEVSEAQLKEIRAQTAAQFTSQQMNRALLEKISDSSLDLAEQMHRQMREVHGIYV